MAGGFDASCSGGWPCGCYRHMALTVHHHALERCKPLRHVAATSSGRLHFNRPYREVLAARWDGSWVSVEDGREVRHLPSGKKVLVGSVTELLSREGPC